MDQTNIARTDVSRIARNLLSFLDDKKIACLSDLEQIMGRPFLMDSSTGEQISVELRPSTFGAGINTDAHTVSYTVPGKGIPLEVRINGYGGYSMIIVKCDTHLPEYIPFAQDPFGNIMQHKKPNSTDISRIKEELEELGSYQEP